MIISRELRCYYIIICAICMLVSHLSHGIEPRRLSRHDVELIQFIRNASSSNVKANDIRPERGQSEYGKKRMTRNKSEKESLPQRVNANPVGPAPVDVDPMSNDYLNDLRHSSLSDWKKKKKEMRLAQKASGIKPPPETGLAMKEYADLEREVNKGGRMVQAPCSPPHCSFRCFTDNQCVTHPLIKKWQPPKPKLCGTRLIHPISFSVPESEVVECVPMKTAEFGTVVPLREKSYVFGPADEAEYKRDYRKAFFGITRKKEGWDCMRHYEILASGTVPMFLDIHQTPSNVLTHLPIDLLKHVREQPFFKVEGCEMKHVLTTCNIYLDLELLDEKEYQSIACTLLEHTRQHLTTKAMARYALEASGALPSTVLSIPRSFKALFVGGGMANSDYLRDLMFHGFRDLLGTNLFEYNTPRYMYDWPSDQVSNGAVQNPNTHWGMGFTIARRLHYKPHLHLKNATAATDLILAKHFDVIIYGNVHRGMPFWSSVIRAGYQKHQIILLNGEDWHGWRQIVKQQTDHKLLDLGTYFLREMPDDCPEFEDE